MMLDFTDVDTLAQLLEAAGIRDVSMDPATLNLPGVLIQITGVSLDVLDGCTILTELLLLAPDTDVRRSADKLAALFNQVTPVLAQLGGPTGDTRAETYVLPNTPAPVPALVVPMALLTTTREE